MSSPIAIQRRSVSPADPNRTGMAASPSSHSGLYVPIHRRTPSSPDSLSSHISSSPLPSRVYTPNALFALQSPMLTPAFTSKMRARIHEACPDVLASAHVRRSAAFRMRKSLNSSLTSTVEAPVPPTLSPVPTLAPGQRATPRRTRPAGRGPERRRAALQLTDNWRIPYRPIVAAHVAVL